MRKKNIIVIVALAALIAFLNFLLGPYVHQRAATRIVTAVLNGWISGAIPETFAYWEDPNAAPPAYGLLSYQINQKVFDKKDGQRRAQIFVSLEFSSSASSTFPSGRQWVFELRQTRLGWKIYNFSLTDHEHRAGVPPDSAT